MCRYVPADIGTLQRLPTIVGHGVATELALTAREIDGEEALRIGLVSGTSPSAEALEARVAQAAASLAAKSPLAVQGTKVGSIPSSYVYTSCVCNSFIQWRLTRRLRRAPRVATRPFENL